MRTMWIAFALLGCGSAYEDRGVEDERPVHTLPGVGGMGGETVVDASGGRDTGGAFGTTDGEGTPASGGDPATGGGPSTGGALGSGGAFTGGGPGTGGSLATGGDTASGGALATPQPCDTPTVQGGNACGGACDWTADTRPAPLGWTSECAPCTARALDGWESWVSVLPASMPYCVARLPADPPVRSSYEVRGDGCFIIDAPWSSIRVHYPDPEWPHSYTTHELHEECAVVRGVDTVGNMPSVLVETFGPDANHWVRAEAVDCSSTCD